MNEESLKDRLARLAEERAEADRAYNDALTALDRAHQALPEFPHPAPLYDATKLSDVNRTWDILPGGPPALDRSIKGRLSGFIWRLVGPALDTQRQFNAAIVDHLNRNVAPHDEAQKATASAIALVRQQAEATQLFQARLLQYLQTVTLYVDSKDRAVGGDAEIVNAALSVMTDDWLKRWESLRAREERFVHRLAGLDDVRATASLAQQTALGLKRDVERLLAHGQASTAAASQQRPGAGAVAAPDLDAFKYLGFEDAFRGSQEDIRAALAAYLPRFAGVSDILDVGCGRGEFLELLREHGIRGRGLDTNEAMVEESVRRGLDVVRDDALSYLRRAPDGSLGGLFASQVVEHLQPDYLAAVLEVAGHKLRPGGVIVLETINPACWLAFFESYIRDLTHVRPLHPETLQYLLRVSGFHTVELEYKSPVAESARLQRLPRPAGEVAPDVVDLIDTFNENVEKLNSRLFTFQDYAVIGRR